jgi:hypothetical protein
MSDRPATPEELAIRRQFTALFVAWRRCVLEYHDPETSDARIKEIERDIPDHEHELARRVLAFPINVPCLIGDKLEVMAHYVNAAGHLDPIKRLVFTGLAALRVDVSHLVNII